MRKAKLLKRAIAFVITDREGNNNMDFFEEEEKEEKVIESIKRNVRKEYERDKAKVLAIAGLVFLAGYVFVFLIRYLKCVIEMNSVLAYVSTTESVLISVVAILTFFAATATKYFRYHSRRRIVFFLSATCVVFIPPVGMIIEFLGNTFVKFLFSLPYDGVVRTYAMTSFFVRTALTLIPLAYVALMCVLIGKLFKKNKEFTRLVYKFSITESMDFRPNKKFLYDKISYRKIEDGKSVVIRENDRYTHEANIGVSGVGKTTGMVSAICDDLNKKVLNEDRHREEITRLYDEGKITFVKPFRYRGNIEASSFVGNDSASQKALERIALDYRSAGITVIAPNSDLLDNVYRLAKARQIPVNRIDFASDNNGYRKEGYKGFNMFYISEELDEQTRYDIVDVAAANFMDVVQSIFELSGGTDAYFDSVNKTISYNVSALVILTFPSVHGRQANPVDVRRILNNFSLLYGENAHKWTSRGEQVVEKINFRENDKGKQVYDVVPVMPNRGTKLPDYIAAFDALPERVREQYSSVRDTLCEDSFCGTEAGQKAQQQSADVKNIINQLFNNRKIREVLSAPDNETVDIDKILANGEVTLFNYGLELGESYATGFGLMFTLSFMAAVKRRPGNEHTRLPNFLYIDEVVPILHPAFEGAFTLFRQYRCSILVAFQQLDQCDKTPRTAYIRKIIQGLGTKALWGRCGATEMEVFSIIGGKEYVEDTQQSYTETSITAANTTMNSSTRSSYVERDIVSGTDLRDKGFQELTLFTLRDGASIDPVDAVVSFINPDEYENVFRPVYAPDEHFKLSEGTAKRLQEEEIRKADRFRPVENARVVVNSGVPNNVGNPVNTKSLGDVYGDTLPQTGDTLPQTGDTLPQTGGQNVPDLKEMLKKTENNYFLSMGSSENVGE